jgi:hypothetical protein
LLSLVGTPEELAVEKNRLTGTIPNLYRQMVDLKDFSLQQNSITGTMPVALCPGLNATMNDLKADCEEIACDCCTGCYKDPP